MVICQITLVPARAALELDESIFLEYDSCRVKYDGIKVVSLINKSK